MLESHGRTFFWLNNFCLFVYFILQNRVPEKFFTFFCWVESEANLICEPFMEQEMTSVENEPIFRLMECTQDGHAMNIGFHKVEQMLDGSLQHRISD